MLEKSLVDQWLSMQHQRFRSIFENQGGEGGYPSLPQKKDICSKNRWWISGVVSMQHQCFRSIFENQGGEGGYPSLPQKKGICSKNHWWISGVVSRQHQCFRSIFENQGGEVIVAPSSSEPCNYEWRCDDMDGHETFFLNLLCSVTSHCRNDQSGDCSGPNTRESEFLECLRDLIKSRYFQVTVPSRHSFLR